MFARFVARRYLFSPKSRSVINLIAGLSVLSVAVPVAAMVILLSVFNGFERLVKSTFSAFDAELTISPTRGHTFAMADLDSVSLAQVRGVSSLSYILEQQALIDRNGHQAAVTVRGVDDAYSDVLPAVSESVTQGSYCVRMGDLDRLVLGRTMAYMLGIRSLANAEVGLYAPRRGSFSTLLPIESYSMRKVDCAGVYALDLDTEREYLLTSLRLAQDLFSYPDKASALLIGLTPDADADQVRRHVAQIVGSTFDVRTRSELRSSFYAIMTYEKWGIFFISLLVLLLASFSVVGALAMLITDKRSDIGTLRCLGASTRQLRSLFMWEGWFVSGIGGLAGLVIGVSFSLLQQHFGFIEIPADTFLAKSYPVEFRLADLGAVAAAFVSVAGCIIYFTVHSMIKKERS